LRPKVAWAFIVSVIDVGKLTTCLSFWTFFLYLSRFHSLGSTLIYSRHFTDAIRYLSHIKNDVYFSFRAALSVILTNGTQFNGAVVVRDHDERPYAG